MPLGNSITCGESSIYRVQENKIAYRYKLYQLLTDNGYTFDFVGSIEAGSNYLPWNAIDSLDYTDNAGFPGILTGQMITLLNTGRNPADGNNCELSSCPNNYLEAFDPDIILLHIGTNGLVDNSDAERFRDDVDSILNIIDAYEEFVNRTIPVFLAQIMNREDPSGSPSHGPTIYYNLLLDNLTDSRTNDEIILVDMEYGAGIDYRDENNGGDMEDYLHLNNSGYEKMGSKWFQYLDNYNYTAPEVSDIPNDTIFENESYITINLNNYVFDPQDPDEDISWSYSPNPAVYFNISITNGIASISAKNPEWYGNETIIFKAEDSGNGSTPLFDTDTVTLDVNVVDSITYIVKIIKESITIYPNPSDDIINIEIENINNATIEIYNVSGRLVFSKELNSKAEKIDLSGLSEGMYFVKVRQENNVGIEKLIIY